MSSTLGEIHKVCGCHHFVIKQLFLSGTLSAAIKTVVSAKLVRSRDGNLTQNEGLRVGKLTFEN